MGIVDYSNKVIYWDEVNWQWLPFVSVRTKGSSISFVLQYKGVFVAITSEEMVLSFLKKEGYTFTNIKGLGIIEVSKNSFLYNEELYHLESSNRSSIVVLIALIVGRSKNWVSRRITGKGVITRYFLEELVLGSSKQYKLKYKGKSYTGYHTLAEDLGLPVSYVYLGISKGKTIEELERGYISKKVTDHLGSMFNSRKDMLSHWGISYDVYRHRKGKGWSLERILTTPVKKFREVKEYSDFKGNVYSSATKIANAYGVSVMTFLSLIDEGKTSEEATYLLSKNYKKPRKEGEISKNRKYKDHLGNIYPTLSEMAKAYNISPSVLYNRRNKGWTLEEALTGKRKE